MNEYKNTSVCADEDVCFTIVDTVATLTDTDPIELDPIGNVVDTDALSTLFGSPNELRRHDASLTFRYEGCTVSVDSDGNVTATRVPATADFDHLSTDAGADGSVGERGDANCG